MKIFFSIITAIVLTGCSQQSNDSSPDAKKKPPSAGKQAVERMTGKTAIKSYKHTQDVLIDVEKSTKARTQTLDDF